MQIYSKMLPEKILKTILQSSPLNYAREVVLLFQISAAKSPLEVTVVEGEYPTCDPLRLVWFSGGHRWGNKRMKHNCGL